MKHKLLLVGQSSSTIDDFFEFLSQDFQVLTSSIRKEDLVAHITVFEPNMVVYCMRNEHAEHIQLVASLKKFLQEKHIFLCIIGNDTECREYKDIGGKTADMILYMPITASIIRDEINRYMDLRGDQLQQDLARQQKHKQETERYMAQIEQTSVEDVPELTNGTEALDALMSFDAVFQPTPEKKTILVIDRDVQTLKFVRDHIGKNYEIATAFNGAFAMKHLDSKPTNLILLNLEMPAENGVTILSMIREREDTKNIPLVFMTSSTDRTKIQRALMLRPQGYLLKPLSAMKLENTVSKLI